MHGSNTFIPTIVTNDLDDISIACATVQELILWINSYTIDKPFNQTKLAIVKMELSVLLIKSPKFNCVVMSGNESARISIKELQICTFLIQLVSGWLDALRSTLKHIPQHNLVVIFQRAK